MLSIENFPNIKSEKKILFCTASLDKEVCHSSKTIHELACSRTELHCAMHRVLNMSSTSPCLLLAANQNILQTIMILINRKHPHGTTVYLSIYLSIIQLLGKWVRRSKESLFWIWKRLTDTSLSNPIPKAPRKLTGARQFSPWTPRNCIWFH